MNDISITELKERMDRGEKLNLFDVREVHEYEVFNIGAELIPLSEFENRISELNHLKNEEIILHCRSGQRSGKAKLMLEDAGFIKVRNLLGGMLEWQEKYGA
ncbi:MAG: rhodanese-like domain-containing protein [Bacteroidia bacterium]|nr:rhodanese-like domain-containing protein [Bacteroidia bacterium]